jgi:hypothetical protein
MRYNYRYTLVAVDERNGRLRTIACFMDKAMMLSAARYRYEEGGWSDIAVIERGLHSITVNRILFDEVTYVSI